MSRMKYAVVFERGEDNFSAYVPDLPGCVATGATLESVRKNIQEAIEFHIEGMMEDGDPIPPPTTISEYVEAGVA
jgi:predicted RNase H-like HicB family nuclease